MKSKGIIGLILLAVLTLSGCGLVDGILGLSSEDPDPVENNTNNSNTFQFDFEGVEIIEVRKTHAGNDGVECIQAVCPLGKKLVGGGGDFNAVYVTEDAPRPGLESWGICGIASESSQWMVQAICVDADLDVTRSSETHTISAVGSQECAQALCPEGSIALGGGYIESGSTAGANRTSVGGWTACAQGNEEGSTITATTICADSRMIDIANQDGERITTKERPEECIQKECREGWRIASGSRAWVGGLTITKSMAIDEHTWEMCGVAPEEGESKGTLEVTCLPDP